MHCAVYFYLAQLKDCDFSSGSVRLFCFNRKAFWTVKDLFIMLKQTLHQKYFECCFHIKLKLSPCYYYLKILILHIANSINCDKKYL